MINVNHIKHIFAFGLLLLSNELCANPTFIQSTTPDKDKPVSTIYSPVVNVYPDENASAFPHKMNVSLLIDKRGRVEDIYYPTNTSSTVKNKVNYVVKTVRFTPYMRNDQPTKSVIPYTVIFNFMSEEDYGGKF
ncbi:hypothetical protein HLH17_06920 [Acinetobacter sp. ANC 5380]|uniref:TonB C-terminal domain-containing protein n=1 Tax=Acinetobacter terrae TaxID=2731247 RepID=A0A7Y2WAL9_9GAMM|nr:hypothetical protein [Acinetobacter terrae]NNH77405.1 hypothetical protein [Acinetobacter terrae]